MNVVKAVVGLGVKGSDIVLSTFKKIKEEKKAFEKPAQFRVDGIGNRIPITPQGVPGTQPKPESDESRRDRKKSESTLTEIAKYSKLTAGAVQDTAQGFASLNPTSFMQSALKASTDVLAETTGGIMNAIISGSGEAVKGAIRYAGDLVNIGLQAGTNALMSYKAALPVATELESKRQLIGETGVKNYDTVTQSERTQLAATILPSLGRIGKDFEKQLDRLFQEQKNGRTVQRDQAMSLAQGDFSALGTTKGWLLNKISQGIGDVPPEVAQKFRSALIGQAMQDKEGIITESAMYRRPMAEMQNEDLSQQTAIADAGLLNAGAMADVNRELNGIQINMIKSVGSLNIAIAKAAKEINSILTNLNTDINKANQKKEEEERKANRRRP